MRKTSESTCKIQERILLTTKEMQNLFGCGRAAAIRLGEDANARVDVGKRVFWNKARLKAFYS